VQTATVDLLKYWMLLHAIYLISVIWYFPEADLRFELEHEFELDF